MGSPVCLLGATLGLVGTRFLPSSARSLLMPSRRHDADSVQHRHDMGPAIFVQPTLRKFSSFDACRRWYQWCWIGCFRSDRRRDQLSEGREMGMVCAMVDASGNTCGPAQRLSTNGINNRDCTRRRVHCGLVIGSLTAFQTILSQEEKLATLGCVFNTSSDQ